MARLALSFVVGSFVVGSFVVMPKCSSIVIALLVVGGWPEVTDQTAFLRCVFWAYCVFRPSVDRCAERPDRWAG